MAKKKAKKKAKRESIEDIIKGVPKRWVKLVGNRIDGRTTEGRNAWIALRAYNQNGNTKKRALLEGLLVSFDGRFMDIVYADPVDYQEGVDARCTCGEHLKNPYLMRVSGRAVREGKESQIIAKIKDAKSLSTQDRRAKGLFFLGRVCYEDITGLLSYFGDDIEERHAKTRKKKSEQTPPEISDELRKRLTDLGIDEEQFQKIHYFIKDASDLSEISSLLYEFDFGKNRSLGNWFREGIHAEQPTIKNPEIIEIFYRLRRAPKSITTKDLAALVTYSYEHRSFESRAVIGSVRNDLEYLSSLDNSDPLIKRFGRFNIDKAYVRPHTRFRERKKNPDKGKTIREKMNEDKLSFLEAIGIGLHFSRVKDRKKDRAGDLEYVRIEANRETSDKYGVGQHWHYILKELRPVFEEVKAELAKDYAKFSKVVREHVLTRDEYNLAKRFFKRSGMGRGTERENYLRMYCIRKFREIAPQIVAIGRKVRYARRVYNRTGDEELKDNALKQEYFSKEELKEKFQALTEIEEEPDKVIDMIVNSGFVKSRSFLRFQREHGQAIGEMYANGLLAKRYFKKAEKSKECVLKRQYDNLRFDGIREVDAETKEKLEQIVEWVNLPFVEYQGPVPADRIKSIKYVSRKGITTIDKLYSDIEKLLGKTRSEEFDPRKFRENKAELESRGRVLYLDEGEHAELISETTYDVRSMKEEAYPSYLYRGKKREYDVSVYNVKGIEGAVKNIRAGVKADKRFLRKLEVLKNTNLKDMGVDKYCSLHQLRQGRYDSVVVSRALKEKVESIYTQVRKLRKP
jgi:hypothetical protein